MVYLSKCPAIIEHYGTRVKRPSAKPRNFLTYAEMCVYEDESIHFLIHVNETQGADVYKILISKSHLYDMLMQHLTYRPIYPLFSKTHPENNNLFYYNTLFPRKAPPVDPIHGIDNMTPVELRGRYRQSVEHMKDYISEASDQQAARAKSQMNRLMHLQWKSELLYEAHLVDKNFKFIDLE